MSGVRTKAMRYGREEGGWGRGQLGGEWNWINESDGQWQAGNRFSLTSSLISGG